MFGKTSHVRKNLSIKKTEHFESSARFWIKLKISRVKIPRDTYRFTNRVKELHKF